MFQRYHGKRSGAGKRLQNPAAKTAAPAVTAGESAQPVSTGEDELWDTLLLPDGMTGTQTYDLAAPVLEETPAQPAAPVETVEMFNSMPVRELEYTPPAPAQDKPEAEAPAPAAPAQAAPAPVAAAKPAPSQTVVRVESSGKKKSKRRFFTLPSHAQLEAELKREKYRHNYRGVLRSTVYTLITVAAVAILTATLWLPVLQIYGSSMTPTLYEGNIVISLKGSAFKTGDVIAFYYNNKILVKRVIAQPGDWVDIDEDGTVYINNQEIEEPYVREKALGECNITLPYQVPDGKIFVMGDHRSVSIDSRNTSVGCVSEEQIVGKLQFCIWPLSGFGRVE